MPCYDPPRPGDEYERAQKEFRHNSEVADMLCAVCKLMGDGWVTHQSDNLQAWWREHKERDRKKAALMLKEQLSAAERRRVKAELVKHFSPDDLTILREIMDED